MKDGAPESKEAHDKIISILKKAALKFPVVETHSNKRPATGTIFKRQRDVEEPSDLVPFESDLRMKFISSQCKSISKRSRYEEEGRPKDVFD